MFPRPWFSAWRNAMAGRRWRCCRAIVMAMGFMITPLAAKCTQDGDFLIEIVGARARDGSAKTNVLIHNGSAPG